MIEQTQKLLDSIFSCSLEGKVITIIAPSGLGKTTFSCMQLPIYMYSLHSTSKSTNRQERVIIVNTDNSLLNERFLQVLKQFNVSYQQLREHLSIVNIQSFYEQDNLVHTIVKQSLEREEIKPIYIAIDPFNHHLRMEFAKAKEEYRLHTVGKLSPRLEHQMHQLSLLARKLNTAVVLTLLPKKRYTTTVPIKWQDGFFGPTEIAHLSDIVLWLSYRTKDEYGIAVHVLKHRLRETPFQVNCRLTEGGLILI